MGRHFRAYGIYSWRSLLWECLIVAYLLVLHDKTLQHYALFPATSNTVQVKNQYTHFMINNKCLDD